MFWTPPKTWNTPSRPRTRLLPGNLVMLAVVVVVLLLQ